MPAIEAASRLQRSGMLHERHAAPLDRVCNENAGLVRDGPELRERIGKPREIVPVTAGDVPAESAELRLDITEIGDLGDKLVGLHLVVVHDDRQVGFSCGNCPLQRLVDLAFLQFAISRQDEHSPGPTRHALAQGHTTPLGDAHPQ